MRHSVLAGISILLLLTFQPAFAQDNDELRPTPFSFQGRVGALFTGGEPFENGAAFEIGMMFRIAGGLHLSFAGGTANFEGGTEPIPLSEEYAEFWELFTEEFPVFDAEPARYRLNFGTVGAALKFGRGRIEPYAVGGVGVYQARFVHTITFIEIASFQDQKYLFGWYAGAGANYSINDIIGFAGQVTYHNLDTDALDNQIMATFGLNVTIP